MLHSGLRLTAPNAMETIKKNTIFTNVLLKTDGTVWWEDGDSDPPKEGSIGRAIPGSWINPIIPRLRQLIPTLVLPLPLRSARLLRVNGKIPQVFPLTQSSSAAVVLLPFLS